MAEPESSADGREYSVQQDDAVCFSAGLTGATFGAGTIHAYLASDRKPPLVAAGISLGALSAAVMERCYRDLKDSRSETARWSWYRRYLSFLLNQPFDVVWDAIPNPSDLIADLPPVREPNLPVDEKGATNPLAEKREVEARRKLYIIAKLGSWMAHLPVKVSSIAWLAVRYVRAREPNYHRSTLWRWNRVCFCVNLLWTLWRVFLHALFRPFWVVERWFLFDGQQIDKRRMGVRPLFGWDLWRIAVTSFLIVVSIAVAAGYLLRHEIGHLRFVFELVLCALLLFGLPGIPIYFALRRRKRPREQAPTANASGDGEKADTTWMERVFARVLRELDIEKSLLSDFPLLLKLFRLFEDKGASPTMKQCQFPVLLVAAPLQVLRSPKGDEARFEGANQLWPKPDGRLPVVRALRACLGVSPWFAPWEVTAEGERENLGDWEHDSRTSPTRLDLVDGAAVRHNPLPALFRFLKHEGSEKLSRKLNDKDARVHLIYNVPIRWKSDPPETLTDHRGSEKSLPNIVEAGLMGLRLAERRDSRLEVNRTNFLSEVERNLREATGEATEQPVHTVTVDEIAPEDELRVENRLNPTETEILTHIAAGCRQTLSLLYKDALEPNTSCWEFLRRHAHRRRWNEAASPGLPGLAEVCRHCTRVLNPAAEPPGGWLPRSFRAGRKVPRTNQTLCQHFPALTGERKRARIVFLASGGVFRGSFHIGMLGAMLALDIKPDLIVGASVGTLMGAVLGSIFKAKETAKTPAEGARAARKRLHDLVTLFVKVDDLVALTKTFKAAAKDLGIRGRSESLQLSPNDLRKMVKRGSREDAGIAATGAPPALIDAISDLFLIPYRETANIAANFVAGHFSEAIHEFWTQIGNETISRLGIYNAVLGANLIEREIRKLLKDDVPEEHADPIDMMQPFLRGSGITFLATTVNLVTESITTLGAELDRTSYDMMEALLASSAFPAAFAPRRASALYPGTGRRDIFYGDGGMFDNLPALSAYEALGEVQKDRLGHQLGDGSWRAELVRRYRNPDLILVGSLNVMQADDLDKPYDSMLKASSRAKRLADNEKIHGLERVAVKIDKMLGQVKEHPRAADKHVPRKTEEFLHALVHAAVLPVYPSDEDHLNGTFQFCKSLGLDRDRVRRSIVGGCFQMMRELHQRQGERHTLAGRSLKATGIKTLELRVGVAESPGLCPYFKASGENIECPFVGVDAIHRTCTEDEVHRGQYLHMVGRQQRSGSAAR